MHKLFANLTFRLVAIGILALGMGFLGSAALSKKHEIVSAKSCTDICVLLTKDGMKPDTITVKTGQYVQFISADGEQHNLGIGGGEDGDHVAHEAEHEHVGDFTSGDFNADEAWRVQFKQPGTYKFHDHYHPKLNILVVVYNPNGTAKIQ